MSLTKQIKDSRSQIYTDAYSISINELAAMYKDGELDIHPAFQRFFRWNLAQKSKFIESILLGIPIPSIFIAQKGSGIWDVIDGLQRLSKIFEFMGILKDKDGNEISPSQLTPTKYLPSLGGKKWTSENNDSIGSEAQLIIKRSKLDVKIILRESTESSKYELFQRINSGGSFLSDQELRNCVLISVRPDSYEWLEELTQFDKYQTCCSLTDKSLSERYDIELALRLLLLRKKDGTEVAKIDNLGDWLTDQMVSNVGRTNYGFKKNSEMFMDIFNHIHEELGDNAFKRYDIAQDRFLGGFLISAFEFITLGLGHNYETYKKNGWPNTFEIIKHAWTDEAFVSKIGSGIRTATRLREIIPLAQKRFSML